MTTTMTMMDRKFARRNARTRSVWDKERFNGRILGQWLAFQVKRATMRKLAFRQVRLQNYEC
jgi:hypothetical protein